MNILENTVEEGEGSLETAVASMLLITAAVVLSCVVIGIAVNTMEQTLNTTNIPQLDQLKTLTNNLLNQTEPFNGTQLQLPSPPPN